MNLRFSNLQQKELLELLEMLDVTNRSDNTQLVSKSLLKKKQPEKEEKK